MKEKLQRILIVTGGLIEPQDTALWVTLRKLAAQGRHARDAYLEYVVKSLVAEPMLALRLERMRGRLLRGLRGIDNPERSTPRRAERCDDNASDNKSLTQALLATLLTQRGLAWETASVNDLFARRKSIEQQLQRTDCVLLSSTYLHDLSELEPILMRLKRPHNRIVLGGALTGTLQRGWQGHPLVDLVAVGYGELLMDSLAAWIEADYQSLPTPEFGRMEEREQSKFIFSGSPPGRSLDALPTPDWTLGTSSESAKRTRIRDVYYESVRGCPYRCNFCNYPYLFDDTVFRYRSARRIADDWEYFSRELGVEYITCLDSLFTVPRARLRELCALLIERKVAIKWICYARADDLADDELVAMMKAAGACQVHVGIESGDAQLLKNMNKACSVESNRMALLNCRAHGLTTVASIIVGFPGETEETLQRTYEFLAGAPPDFHFLIPFSTRVQGVPLLEATNRARFGLRVAENAHAMAPYWEHATMSCSAVGSAVREMERLLMKNRVSLNAALFYGEMLGWNGSRRKELLDLQSGAATRHPILEQVFGAIHGHLRRRLEHAVNAQLQEKPGCA